MVELANKSNSCEYLLESLQGFLSKKKIAYGHVQVCGNGLLFFFTFFFY